MSMRFIFGDELNDLRYDLGSTVLGNLVIFLDFRAFIHAYSINSKTKRQIRYTEVNILKSTRPSIK